MQPLRIILAAHPAEYSAEGSAHFIGVVVPLIEGDRDLDKNFTVLADPAECVTVKLAALCWAEVRLCYFFAPQFAEFLM